jgi:hypothetical protein
MFCGVSRPLDRNTTCPDTWNNALKKLEFRNRPVFNNLAFLSASTTSSDDGILVFVKLSESIPLLVSYHHHRFYPMSFIPSRAPSRSPSPAGDDLADRMLRARLAEMQARHSNPPTPSVSPPPASPGRWTVAFSSQPPEFSSPGPGFQGGSISQAQSSPRVFLGDATPCPVDPCDVPLGVKPVGKRSLSGMSELSVFDILNIFRRRWFLSIDHLRAQALSAQKAEDGKIFWVEFTPQFHAHLVKCAVALVPHPIQKVKKVMFGYILELLNDEGPRAFFDLKKGARSATQAQKEKKRLARKRNRASRRERRKAAAEATQSTPHRQCKLCGRKFASRKAAKRHRCPLSKEVSRKSGTEKSKGNSEAPSKPSKPAPKKKTPAPPAPHLTPSPTEALVTAAAGPPPTSALEAAAYHTLPWTLRGAEAGPPGSPQPSGSCRSQRLNTAAKRNIRKGVMDTIRDKT